MGYYILFDQKNDRQIENRLEKQRERWIDQYTETFSLIDEQIQKIMDGQTTIDLAMTDK